MPKPSCKLSQRGRYKFDYIPVTHRFYLWYANSHRAKELKVYKETCFEKIEFEVKSSRFLGWEIK